MRSLSLLFAALTLSSLPSTTVAQNCPTKCVRREVRALSQGDRDKYFAAVKKMMDSGKYDSYTRMHVDYQRMAHGAPGFLVWHRAFLREFEKDLQAIDNSVCLHYWSWDIDSQSPEASPVWGSGYYQGDSEGCVNSGWLANWRPAHPSRHCLRRSWDGGNQISAFYSPEMLNRLITSSNGYNDFRTRLENSPHGSVHTNIGGDMSQMHSPNDPIFYAHHTFIDKLYADWQRVHPGAANTYNGRDQSGRSVGPSDRLTPMAYTVNDVFNTNALCYSYEELSSARASAAGVAKAADADQPSRNADPKPPTALPTLPAHCSLEPSNSTVCAPNDRRNIISLRVPNALSEAWIQMNNGTVEEVRTFEADYADAYGKLNGIYGYVSPASLYHRADLFAHIIRSGGSGACVVPAGSLGQLRVSYTADNGTDPYQVISQIKQSVRQLLPDTFVDPGLLKDKVMAVTGLPTASGSQDSAGNFLKTPDAGKGATSSGNKAGSVFASVVAVMVLSSVALGM